MILLPRPILSVAIFLLWLIIANAATPGALVVGGILALALPLVTRSFWPDAPRIACPAAAWIFAVRLIADILAANLAVARRVVGPLNRLSPAFVEVPLELRDPFVATLLASIVSLTPGTVAIDVDQERWVLSLHALDAPDPDALIRTIQQRYEAALQEIFAC